MADIITAAEAAAVLTRLVQDRKRLEKGAEIASALAGMEQATKEREAQLLKLDQQITEKQTVLDGMDSTIRDKEFSSTMHLQSVESDYKSKIDSLKSTLDGLIDKISQAKEEYHLQEVKLTSEHNLLVDKYQEQEHDLSMKIQKLRVELEGLKQKATILSGV